MFLFINSHPFCWPDFHLRSGQGSCSLSSSNFHILGAGRKYLKRYWRPTQRVGPEIKWWLISDLETFLSEGVGRQMDSYKHKIGPPDIRIFSVILLTFSILWSTNYHRNLLQEYPNRKLESVLSKVIAYQKQQHHSEPELEVWRSGVTLANL